MHKVVQGLEMFEPLRLWKDAVSILDKCSRATTQKISNTLQPLSRFWGPILFSFLECCCWDVIMMHMNDHLWITQMVLPWVFALWLVRKAYKISWKRNSGEFTLAVQPYEKKQTPEYVGPSLVGGQGLLVKGLVCSLFSQSFLCHDKETCPQ